MVGLFLTQMMSLKMSYSVSYKDSCSVVSCEGILVILIILVMIDESIEVRKSYMGSKKDSVKVLKFSIIKVIKL